MGYSVDELAAKFDFEAKRYLDEKEAVQKASKKNNAERFNRALAMLESSKPRLSDVHILASHIYDYLNVKRCLAYSLGKTLYQGVSYTRFLNLGREYFIYGVNDSDGRYFTGNSAILIKYEDGSINYTHSLSTGSRDGDYANDVRTGNIYRLDDVQAFVTERLNDGVKTNRRMSFDDLNLFSDAIEQVPVRIDMLFKYAEAFADTVDGNLAMADYIARYRK